MDLKLSKIEIYALIALGVVFVQLCLAVGIAGKGTNNAQAVAAGSFWPIPGVGLIAAIVGLVKAN